MQHRTLRTIFLTMVAAVLSASVATAATISSSLPSGQRAGTKITFTIGGEGNPNEAYRLSVGPANNPADVHVVYDFHDATTTFDWTPINPGSYIVVGSVLNIDTGAETHSGMQFNVGPVASPARVRGVAVPTSNPLIAYYGAPPCPQPAKMRVLFFSPAIGLQTTTQPKNCVPGMTMNFIIAGMQANQTYLMRHQIVAPDGVTVLGQSPFTGFQTGTPTVEFMPVIEEIPFDIQASILESVLLQSAIVGRSDLGIDPNIHAVDLEGNLVWYLEDVSSSFRPGGNGSIWTNRADPITGIDDNMLGRVNLLGHVVQQTTVTQVNRQLAAMGVQEINDFHHEARPLPNGHLAVLTTVERILTDEQGPGDVNVIGDAIIVLDQDMQVTWYWNMFDELDRTRLSTTGDVCTNPGAAGCGQYFNGPEANDWTHSNGLAYSHEDGDLIVSIRHQDWLVKVNYADGAGDGAVEWRLGPDGDFTLTTGNDDDWFSHTHDPSYTGPDTIVVYDNSNVRCDGASPPPDCQSRGQEWQIDETLMTATPILNANLGQYARAVGSAQLLVNGNYFFNSGITGLNPTASTSHFQETLPDGTTILDLHVDMWTYRSHRLLDLYTMPPFWEIPQ